MRKRCDKCRRVHPTEDFEPSARSADGLMSKCRRCRVTKTCKKCGRTKTLEKGFHRDASYPDGRNNTCRKCINERLRSRRGGGGPIDVDTSWEEEREILARIDRQNQAWLAEAVAQLRRHSEDVRPVWRDA